jgi:PKD repeat protein
MKRLIAFFLFLAIWHNAAMAQSCYSSSITSPVPFMGTGQETVTLLDGSKWKITDYTYLYLYAYYPTVTICPGIGKLLVGTNSFNVTSASTVVVPPTYYTFRICNQSNVAVFAAYGRNDITVSSFMSHGWYPISAGTCSTVSSSTTRYRYFYVYAEGTDNMFWQDPSGAYRFCVDPVKAFDLTTGNCSTRGFAERYFIEVDTGTTSTSFTFNLTGTAVLTPTVAAQFTATPKTGNAPLVVNFYGNGSSTSTSDQLSYFWTFGDGTTSTQQNPVHTFSAGGTYSVTLKVSNTTGQTSTTQAQTITVATPVPVLAATVTAVPTSGSAPLAVKFTGRGSSTAASDSLTYLWLFGDGTSSTEQSPSHTFSAAGNYSVTLKISNTSGQTATSQPQMIVVAAEISSSVSDDADKVFAWAERAFSSIFSPAGGSTQTIPGYRYRAYAGGSFLAVNDSGTPHLLYIGPLGGNGGVLDLGLLSTWLSQAAP